VRKAVKDDRRVQKEAARAGSVGAEDDPLAGRHPG